VSDSRQPADRPLPERLALGEASRLLGVDPDTLRRWADEGRVPAFTTPGGHRRFERRALERLIAARRTGPAGGLASLGASQDRLSAAYRRRYGEHHGGKLDPRATVPASERESYREVGRKLSIVARRRGVEGARIGELYDTSTGLLDRLLLAFVAAHESASQELASADARARRDAIAGAHDEPTAGAGPSVDAEHKA